MKYVVRRRLINGFAGGLQEGLRLVRVALGDSVDNLAGRLFYARFFRDVLSVAFRIRFNAQDRCFNIRQILHPLGNKIYESNQPLRGRARRLPVVTAGLASGL